MSVDGGGGGEDVREGNGSLDADNRGFGFDLRRTGLGGFSSDDEVHGSSSS
jgi:hypothetical protein